MHQRFLFDQFPAHAAGLIKRLKAAMNQCVKESKLSRAQIMDRMNAIAQVAGVRLTTGNSKSLGTATFNKWLNPSDTDHVPGVLAVNVFCAALDDIKPIEIQLAMHGCETMTELDRKERDYGRACLAIRTASREKRKLEASL
jgi:hypothetical protein